MKPYMLLVEIIIITLYLIIVRPTKIMKRADKNWAYFRKMNYFKNQSFLVEYSSEKKKIKKIPLIFNTEIPLNFDAEKMTLKIRILRYLRRSSIIIWRKK